MKRKKTGHKKRKLFFASLGGIILLLGFIITFPSLYVKKEEGNKKIEENTPVKEEPKLKIWDLKSNTRPIAVMINNHNQARKYHAGLQEAYIVYEMIVEGGITRLMALYKDVSVAKIGSIRSARHYFLDYVLENDATFVHWGYSEYAMNDIKKLGINHMDGLIYGNQYFWKDKSLKVATEHTAFSSTDLIKKGIEQLHYRNTTNFSSLLNYSIENIDVSSIEGAIPANQVQINYAKNMTSSYVYDPETSSYKRYVNALPHMDYETQKQYTAKNIITYQVKNTTIKNDPKGRQDINNLGNGEGYYITNGYAIPIIWEKKTRESKTIYRLKDGSLLKVNDGNTYIQIQPVGQTLSIS